MSESALANAQPLHGCDIAIDAKQKKGFSHSDDYSHECAYPQVVWSAGKQFIASMERPSHCLILRLQSKLAKAQISKQKVHRHQRQHYKQAKPILQKQKVPHHPWTLEQ